MRLKVLLARLLYWFISLKEDPKKIFTGLEMSSNDEVLEIGCAIGYHTFPLADIAEDGHVYAVDISEDLVEYAKKRKNENNQNLTFICEDAENLSLKNKNFDKIVCFNTLHDLDSPRDAIQNWLDHLKTDGLFLFKDAEISPEGIVNYSDEKLSKVKKQNEIQVLKKT